MNHSVWILLQHYVNGDKTILTVLVSIYACAFVLTSVYTLVFFQSNGVCSTHAYFCAFATYLRLCSFICLCAVCMLHVSIRSNLLYVGVTAINLLFKWLFSFWYWYIFQTVDDTCANFVEQIELHMKRNVLSSFLCDKPFILLCVFTCVKCVYLLNVLTA